ncbi:RPII140-upstream gene protein [Anoplophora glabripennis]|uniref:RPII140-upstream gene protein n=1 Tax=Anoplophora glabripennis TaxID=217634 RepID=UPI0008754563|nr:RPII140-upstream gene protein [Anoplophora glabripennis]
MIRNTLQNGIKYAFLPISSWLDGDQLENRTPTEQEANKSLTEKETGWDRLKKMFEVDEFGNVSREVNSILQVGVFSLFIGGVYGGVINSRSAYLEFMQNNEATSFKSHLDAKQKLQDKVTISFGKGAFKWGWRLTLFCTSFVGISTAIQTYRGKYGIREYVIAGGMTGAMYKFNMGPRGWIIGGGLGSVLGLICGGTTIGLLKLTGISMEEARYWQYYLKHSRDEYFRKGMADYLQKEDFAVIKLHDDQIGEAGKDISNLDRNVNSADKK